MRVADRVVCRGGCGSGGETRSTNHATRLLSLAALLTLPAAAQVPADPLGTSTEAEAQFEALVEDDLAGDPTELLELLESLRADPLDVNTATAEELAQVPALGAVLGAAIVRYRAATGPFTSLPGLRQVDGVTRELVWPSMRISHCRPPGSDRDIVLMHGVEPNMRWRTF